MKRKFFVAEPSPTYVPLSIHADSLLIDRQPRRLNFQKGFLYKARDILKLEVPADQLEGSDEGNKSVSYAFSRA